MSGETALRIPQPIVLETADGWLIQRLDIDLVADVVRLQALRLSGDAPAGQIVREFPLSAFDARLGALASAPGETFQEKLYALLVSAGILPAGGVVSGLSLPLGR